MMRALQVAKMVALLALAFLLIALSVLLIRARREALELAAKTNAVMDAANRAMGDLDAALVAINRPCGNGKPCGTLAGIGKTLNTVRGTAGEIEIAARHEDARIGVLDAQEAQIYADTHGALQSANRSLAQLQTDLGTANATMAGLQPVETGLNEEVAALQTATRQANLLLGNSDVQATLKNASQASASMAAIADDTRQAVQSYLHPKWPRKVWNAVTGVGVTAAKILW